MQRVLVIDDDPPMVRLPPGAPESTVHLRVASAVRKGPLRVSIGPNLLDTLHDQLDKVPRQVDQGPERHDGAPTHAFSGQTNLPLAPRETKRAE